VVCGLWFVVCGLWFFGDNKVTGVFNKKKLKVVPATCRSLIPSALQKSTKFTVEVYAFLCLQKQRPYHFGAKGLKVVERG